MLLPEKYATELDAHDNRLLTLRGVEVLIDLQSANVSFNQL